MRRLLVALKHRYDLRVNGCGFAIGSNGISPFPTDARVAQKKKHLFKGAISALLNTINPDYLVNVVTDIEKDADEHFRGWIESLARTESAKVAHIVGIGFYDDLYFPPIQFADLVAWFARADVERLVLLC
jgi:hypothetical protein